jgi:phosphate:Na+ symporter
LIFIWFIPYYADLIEMISPKGPEVEVIARQIANAHTGFNVVNTLIFIPLVGILVKAVTKLVPGKDMEKLPTEPVYLDYHVLEQPFAALHLATKELVRLGNMVLGMMDVTQKAFVENNTDKIKEVFETENTINELQHNIMNYLGALFSTETITEEQSAKVSGLIHIAGDIEHIGDHCENIVEFAEEKIQNSYEFSEEAYAEIYGYFDMAKKMLTDSISALENRNSGLARSVKKFESEMDSKEIQLRKHHMQRLNDKKCSPEFTVIYTDVVHNIEKMGDYCNNIAEAVLTDVHDDVR